MDALEPLDRSQAGKTVLRTVRSVDDVPNTVLCDLLDYWYALRGGSSMPAYKSLDPLEIPRPVLPHVFLNDVVAPNQFRVRLQGTESVRQSGIDLTGRLIHEIEGAEETQQRFEAAMRTKLPYYCRAPLAWSHLDYKTYEAIVLPLADIDGHAVRQLFGASLFS